MTTSTLWRRTPATDQDKSRTRPRLLATAVAFAVLVIGTATAVLGGAAPAQASNGCYHYKFISSNLDIKVENASLNADARLVQAVPRSNAAEFGWCLYSGNGTVLIVNERSGLCMTTDGIAGHWLTQQPCDGRWGVVWQIRTVGIYQGYPVYTINSYYYNLNVDVYQDSHTGGTVIDAWYPKAGATNQILYQFDV
jgi:hypothetical protein